MARGKYVYDIAACAACHSPRDFSRIAGPVAEGQEGSGRAFSPDGRQLARVHAPNITPDRETGLGAWTDGEILRAVRDGIGRHGRALHPLMPYRDYRHLSDEDAHSLVAFLRTLQPLNRRVPPNRLTLEERWRIRRLPAPAGVVPSPDSSSAYRRGEYLTRIAGCVRCHSGEDALGGGRIFRSQGNTVRAANITPDPRTGIGRWTEDEFLERFRQYRSYDQGGCPPSRPETFTVMPWLSLSRMSDDDLRAVYLYLRLQKSFFQLVETHPAPSTPSE